MFAVCKPLQNGGRGLKTGLEYKDAKFTPHLSHLAKAMMMHGRHRRIDTVLGHGAAGPGAISRYYCSKYSSLGIDGFVAPGDRGQRALKPGNAELAACPYGAMQALDMQPTTTHRGHPGGGVFKKRNIDFVGILVALERGLGEAVVGGDG